MTTGMDTTTYRPQGFVLARGLLDAVDFELVERRFLSLANERTGGSFPSIHEPGLASAISNDRELEMHLYDEIRTHPELADLSLSSKLTNQVRALLDDDNVVLLEKIPFRIDCPMVMRELAIWHQDHFYVRGDPNTITAWIPLQDTAFAEGCPLVMPGSHAAGPMDHDVNVLKKKWYPSDIFNRELRYVEMQRGDVLFLHGCVLHSSGNNISDTIRFSIQARYLSASSESDPGMGKRIQAR